MPRSPRVILLIESSRSYGRGCLSGIAEYVRRHGPWQILHLERTLGEELPALARRWRGDGIIARIDNRTMERALARMRLPVVDLRGLFHPAYGAMIDTDDEACSRVAVQHFRERGFRHFAFCGYSGVDFSDQRCEYFARYLAELGHRTSVFSPSGRQPMPAIATQQHEAQGELDEPQIARWLTTLPRPVAVFACNDMRGRQVLAACCRAKLSVPDEVAVLGVDNDEVVCKLSTPPLSSIEPDTLGLGYQAAELLDGMIAGQTPPSDLILRPPTGVVVRRSSDVLAVEDSELAAAMGLIRDHACEGITVEELVRKLNISRATLERRFSRIFNRTPKAEIERVRFEQAMFLLHETAYKLDRIAAQTGFGTAAQFATAFKRRMGQTPGQFRRESGRHPGDESAPPDEK